MEKNKNMLVELNIDSSVYKTRLSKKFINRKSYAPVDKRKVHSFIPGTIVELLIEVGSEVNEGDEILVLEAMKMKNRIKAPVSGRVSRINVSVGEKLPKGTLLLEFE
jgi:biotin carboxyl carrier protein